MKFLTCVLIAAVIYWGVMIPLLIVAKGKTSSYYKQLQAIEKEGNDILWGYWNATRKELELTGDGYMCFDNGLAVNAAGEVCVFLGKNYGRMKLWSCGPGFDRDIKKVMYDNFEQRNDKVLLGDKIASLEFSQHVCVVADKGTERDCLAYLSPSVQLNLRNNREFYKYIKRDLTDNSLFEVYNDKLFVKVNNEGVKGGCAGYRVFPYDGLELEAPTLTNGIKNVDLYKETFPVVAFRIAAEFDEKVGFLRGSAM